MNNNRLTISNILILLSIIATLLAFVFPNLYMFGINSDFLNERNYLVYFVQFFTGTFLHLGIFHLLFNSIFIFYFGNIVEGLIGRKGFFIFFIFVTIFNGALITLMSQGNTVGISGFCMALISYYTLELRSRSDPEYKGGITAIIINIAIGFTPGISLYGHLFGAIAGIIYYLITKDFFRRKYVGIDA